MKITIVVENGKVEIAIDDNQKQTLTMPKQKTEPEIELPNSTVLVPKKQKYSNSSKEYPTLKAPLSPSANLPIALEAIPDTSLNDSVVKDVSLSSPIATVEQKSKPVGRRKNKYCLQCKKRLIDKLPTAIFCDAKCKSLFKYYVKKQSKEADKLRLLKANPIPYKSKLSPSQKMWGSTPIVPSDNKYKESTTKKDRPITEPRDLSFKDPWNCAVCRNAGDLCVMHEELTKEGKSLSKYKPYTSGHPQA